MDRVQLADNPLRRGCHTMSDTDTTYAITAPSERPSALGDLRFAGTVAAGLVAGTLGLGALAAPLVGWRDWPAALTQEQPTTVTLAKPAAQAANTARSGGQVPGTSVRVPGGASALTALGGPALGAAAGDTSGLGVLAVPTSGSGGSTGSAPTSVGTAGGSGTGVVLDTGTGFVAPDTADSDGDGILDVYEAKNGLNPTDASDAATDRSGTGLSNYAEFRIRSQIADGDSNHDGVIDGSDDSDGDGVSNAVEERNGTDPADQDSNHDGISDGMEDADGD